MSVFLTCINICKYASVYDGSNKILNCGFGPKKACSKSRENENHFAHKTTEAKSFSAEMIYGRADVNPQE